MIQQLTETQREQLYDYVDESDYSLTDWEAALVSFDSWLRERDIIARPVDSMLGYLHCCTLSNAETLSAPDLAGLLEDMLERHGFDAAQSASADEPDADDSANDSAAG